MATFQPGTSITTEEPVIAVDAGLKPGTHVFTLVVEDEQGNRSDPSRAAVTIVEGHGHGGPFHPVPPIVLDPHVHIPLHPP